MRFIAKRIDRDVINRMLEFGFEDVGNVYVADDIMYARGEPVVLSSVSLLSLTPEQVLDARLLAVLRDFVRGEVAPRSE